MLNNAFLKTTIDLLKFFTFSQREYIMRKYLKKELRRLGFKTSIDSIGNITAVRGKSLSYPLLNAHMDVVYEIDNYIEIEGTQEDRKRECDTCENYYDCVGIKADDDNITWNEAQTLFIGHTCQHYIRDEYSDYLDMKENDWSYSNVKANWKSSMYYEPDINDKKALKDLDNKLKDFKITYTEKTGLIEGNGLRLLGGDDKCGIAIALQVAKELKSEPMKLLFTVQEEIGCIGIKHFCKYYPEWFNDVKYSITIDRRGGNELINKSCGVKNCSNAFAGLLVEQGLNANIMVKCADGSVADVMHIRNYVDETCNMSAGYYEPHTLDEYINFKEMIKIKEWCKNIVKYI